MFTKIQVINIGTTPYTITADEMVFNSYDAYSATGQVGAGGFSLGTSGTVATNSVVKIFWKPTGAALGGVVSILGDTMPTNLRDKACLIEARYNGSSWDVFYNTETAETGWITNAEISATAAIALTKLATIDSVTADTPVAADLLLFGDIGESNAYNRATLGDIPITGDITGTLGATTINAGAIVAADVNAAAGIEFSKLEALTAGNILVGSNPGNVATSVTMSGDATIDDLGAVTIANNAIIEAKIADAAVTTNKIGSDAVTLRILDSTGQIESFTTSSPTPASTAETTLATYTLASYQIDADGETLEVFAYGSTAANANNKTLRLKIGTTTLASNTTTAAPNNLNWTIKAKIFRTGAASQKGTCEITFNGIATEIDNFTAAEVWAANTISITGQNGTAAANDIILEGFEIINNKENNT